LTDAVANHFLRQLDGNRPVRQGRSRSRSECYKQTCYSIDA
jgi:hypothetical protein